MEMKERLAASQAKMDELKAKISGAADNAKAAHEMKKAELEETLVLRVLAERAAPIERFGAGIKISFNVTGATVSTPRFLQFLRQQNAKTPFRGKNLCLEVTEPQGEES